MRCSHTTGSGLSVCPDQRFNPLIGANRQAKGETIPAKRRTQRHCLKSARLQLHQFLRGLSYWEKSDCSRIAVSKHSRDRPGPFWPGLAWWRWGESNRGTLVRRRSCLYTTLGFIRARALFLFMAVRQRPPGLLSALLSTGEQSRSEVSAHP
jgi:hypothetical protein